MSVPLRVTVLLIVMLTAGCGDERTLTEVDRTAANQTTSVAPDEEHQAPACCDPIIVVVKGLEECDPYLSLDGCEGDGDCMSSAEGFQTTLGCVPPGGTGGGGTPPCDPNWDPSCSPADESDSGTCNPHTNPDCLQRLSLWDKQTIALAFARHRRTVFTDSNAEQMCNLLVTQFNQLLASGSVYRGGFTSTGEPNDRFHVAAYDPAGGTIHFEPDALAAANAGDPAAIRSIFNSALHEAAHALNYQHTEPVWSGTYDLYAETPFNLLSPGANSCITNS